MLIPKLLRHIRNDSHLKGIAPVCRMVPSVILQNTYKDCDVAVKTLPIIASDEAKADFMEEINFMKHLAYHPHLVCMLGIATATCGQPCLVVEYCCNGDLLHYVRNNKQTFTEGTNAEFQIKNLVSLAWQISDGLYYLNSKDIVHRDIAARNILLDDSFVAKIGDFGLCRYADHTIYHTRGGRLPLKWMAIETLKTYEYSSKSDVWSFGVLLYEMFSLGDVPFPDVQPAELIDHLDAGHRLIPPSLCPEAMAILMQKCWISDPEDRISIKSIRDELSKMLETSTEEYGYFKLKDDYYYKWQ
uniref:Protein kinase domain-containing protein n=1 Tax=Syphacia muris TaxID=451379 RepID=A0A0N5AKL1_9BILA